MIRYALECCDCDETFEGWFASSEGFDTQKEKGLITDEEYQAMRKKALGL